MLNLHVKEINWLISKGMCVLLFDAFKWMFFIEEAKR